MSGMEDYRAEVARYMARLYDRGLTTACGGNVSLRAGDLMYITPSSIDKAAIMPSQGTGRCTWLVRTCVQWSIRTRCSPPCTVLSRSRWTRA